MTGRGLLIAVLSCWLLSCLGPAAESPSVRLDLNTGWRFIKEDRLEASRPDFDDSRWRLLDLPHDWSIEGPFDPNLASSTGFLPGGIGWYRRSFDWVPRANRRLSIHFEAVHNNSDVWINGHRVGHRPNGYISFEYDLTPHLAHGENVVAVRVDHSKYLDSRWYTGSGIYGRVFLIDRPLAHFKTWGIHVSTPEVDDTRAAVRVDATVTNAGDTAADFSVAFQVRDQDGTVIASSTVSEAVEPRTDATFGRTLSVPEPMLWSPDHPTLYSMTITLTRGDTPLDEAEVPFGIRSFHFDPSKGFFLNGRSVTLKGVCIHHDAGALGAAVPRDVWARRLRILKEAGTNAIRLSHNPATPHILDLCDSMGFLVMAEAFDEWEHGKNKWRHGWNKGVPGHDGYHEHFREWAQRDLQDMILRDRNHPSIILWSIGNEVDYPNDPYSHPILGDRYDENRPDASSLGEIATQLVSWAKEIDDTRPVTAALASALMSNETRFPFVLDVVGYNYQEDRYAEDKQRYPARILYGSENKRHHEAWKAVVDNDFISSQFLWTGIDYMGESREWPARNSTAGIIDLAGFRKARYFFRKSYWTTEPMVQLATSDPDTPADRSLLHWNWKEVGKPVKVYGITNSERIELFLNGRSLGEKMRSDFIDGSAEWIVPFEPGTLKASARNGDTVLASSRLETAGSPFALRVETDKDTMRANGEDVIHVEVRVVDRRGNIVPDAKNTIHCEVSGAARLIGLESGDPESHEDYKADFRKAHRGRLLIYLQSKRVPGEAVVKIASDGLETKTIELSVE
jgi:beta-galactosidase/beta-glucuronidase